MLPSDLENYLSEISRVLKLGGKCFITYFMLNEESIGLISKGKSSFSLKHTYKDCRIETLKDPEHVIAYPEHKLVELYWKYNLKILNTYFGNWCSREKYTSYQDIIIGEKNATIA